MNFAQALRGPITRFGKIKEIYSAGETELGRKMTDVEFNSIITIFSLNNAYNYLQKYGYGTIRFLLFLSERPSLKCTFSPNPTPRDGNCLIHALADGFKQTEALKHTQSQLELLQDLGFNSNMSDFEHKLYLRRRLVLGAAEWLVGMHGSKENEKLKFGYTDKEWEWIWSTMIEDGAWAVPALRDIDGNYSKENFAPELLIKYAAHELKRHIVVFDLRLNRIQFCSGNYLKDENIIFEVPLILYATGAHFQSVLAIDYECVSQLTNKLELENGVLSHVTSKEIPKASNTPMNNEMKNKETKNNDKTEGSNETETGRTSKIEENELEKRLNERSEGSLKFEECLPDHLRGKRPKDMTKDEKKEYNNFRAKQSRSRQDSKQTVERKERNREVKATKRSQESEAEGKLRRQNAAESKAMRQVQETEEEGKLRRQTAAESKARKQAQETEADGEIRRQKHAESQARKRSRETTPEASERNIKDKQYKANKKSKESVIEKEKRIKKEAALKKLKRSQHIPKSQFAARNALKVLSGEQIVPELKDSENKLGSMNVICDHCKARKWKSETASLCCNGGKIKLDLFPDPPQIIKNLLTTNSPEANLFKENTRSFNNALALSSVRVNEKRFKNGYSPSVIFEGKVTQMCGPLLPEEGETPRFAQLYVHDPATEHTTRVKNMCLPKHLSKRQTNIITNTMGNLQTLLKEVNPFVKDLLHICEIPDGDLQDGKIIISCKKQDRPSGSHERRYNLQQSLNEVSVLSNSVPGDLVLRKRGGGIQRIYDLHPAAQPLHFVLLFPFGTQGCSEFLMHNDPNKVKRVSPREFYAYHLNMRNLEADFLFRFGRLFQEYICLAYVTMENQRLKFQKNNQGALRADSYKNVKSLIDQMVPMGDRISKDDHNLKIGRRIVLSKSFVGSPRWYHSQFQDGMAICRKFHKPDFFITLTCNPKWTEITTELREGEKTQDRPDLVARIFKQKKDQLMKDIRAGSVLGKVPAFLWVIEFQKRGLPHAHILVILSSDDRVSCNADVDNVISAQLPPDPELFPEGSEERKQAERLEKIVVQNMIHGPCGKLNPNSPCMIDGKCSKNYPKKFCEKTVVSFNSTYPEYQRLEPAKGGRKITIDIQNNTIEIDNRWIVPYSPFVLLKFNCHANFEICISPTAAKYLFKYITKGEDRAMVKTEIESDNLEVVDEIADYIDLRSVGSSEASWHIFSFNIAKKYPAVYALRVHLEHEQNIVFDMDTAEESVENQRCTELTAFLDFNRLNPETRVTYVDFPEQFTWQKKEWHPRKRGFSDTIGRIHIVNPAAGDVYFLRMLLHHDHCKGRTSFDDLKVHDGSPMESFQEVCKALGLLQDDSEWDEALSEGALTKMPATLRELFITIVLFCMPSNPKELFEKHHMEWADDFTLQAQKKNFTLTEYQLRVLVLIDIQTRLQSWDKTLKLIQLPEPSAEDMAGVSFYHSSNLPVLIREELEFDVADLAIWLEETIEKCTESQKAVFDFVLNAIEQGDTAAVFIDARGGTGKTYVLNIMLAAVRSLAGGSIALAVGATGIAANLLHLGRTFHSRFKAPLILNMDSVCNINAQSTLARLISMAKLIVWDEAPMSHKYQLEALDRTLRDITDIDKPFGGKVIVLSGDFRQCLPVIPGATRAEIVDACLKRSYLWKFFKVMKLKENMRVQMSNDPDAESFDKFTLQLGDGNLETVDGTDLIELPADMCMEIPPNSENDPESEKTAMTKLAQHVYPKLGDNWCKAGWMDGRAILAPTNAHVDQINNLISDFFPGDPLVFLSSDELINSNDFQRYNAEYLNTLSPSGLPAHRLFLKPGMPLMLMRNLNPKMGLCNGTRLIFKKVHKNLLLECTIAGGEHKDRKVLIPRILLKPKDREFPFEWSRRQFPVRVAFAMTINKSQGQTLRNVGVWLNDTCFGHGQLYVCISRVGSPKNIKFSIRRIDSHPFNLTSNVVYKEVLDDGT